MVQLHSTALTTKATENNTITRRNQQRSTSFSENAESKISGLEKEKILPVFVFPLELHFHPNDVKSLTQTVKIYNPYSWPIKFKFLVKTARLWEISEPGGVINSDCFYDVCVRLLDRSPSLIGKKDYLRVSMQTITESLKLGVRDLPCLFLPGERADEDPMQAQFPDPLSSNVDRFTNKLLETPPPTVKKPQEIAAPSDDSASSKRDTQGANKNRSKNEPPSNWPPSAYVFTAIMCGIILCLPTEECILPTYLVISHTPKYIAAYVLGIITSILCKYY